MSRFSVRELIEEAQRETRMRRQVYDRRVAAGKMSPVDAQRKIQLMEAIAERLIKTAAI